MSFWVGVMAAVSSVGWRVRACQRRGPSAMGSRAPETAVAENPRSDGRKGGHADQMILDATGARDVLRGDPQGRALLGGLHGAPEVDHAVADDNVQADRGHPFLMAEL